MSTNELLELAGKEKGAYHDPNDAVTVNALRRLRNIEGQIRGIQKMVEMDKYCIDILTQISAARSALNSVGMKVLRRHVETCVSEAIEERGAGSDEMIDELMMILSRQEL
ncbi:MAG: metal-sensitive transcriptional regulator [Spirochaetales bacterium]|jgi:CsoR family transcriptional regulator, copper-sensing transcriptional repressor|nr:metal-sensitive transcriptional regulator [Spirochaetales bacterium]